MDETKIIAVLFSRIMNQLDLEELGRIYEAEKAVAQANRHLGLNAQLKAGGLSRQAKHETIEALPPYAIARIKNEIKLAARELEDLTNE